MRQDPTVKIYVVLLEEGTPTWRPTQAVDLGGGLYKLLQAEDYSPESETWEFPPGSIVKGIWTKDDQGEELLLAIKAS